MKMYKGLITIECRGKKKCIKKKPLKEVQPDCSDCPQSVITIVDLEGKSLTVITNNKITKTIKKEK